MIVDTNALSAWRDGDSRLLPVLSRARPVTLPVITIGEYRAGLMESHRRTESEQWLEGLLRTVQVVPVTLATTLQYARVRSQLKVKGRPIPANDMWIAALALQHRLPVLSRDAHFDAVDGLTRIDWQA